MLERMRRPGLIALSMLAGASLLRSSMALSSPDAPANPTVNFSLAEAGSDAHHGPSDLWAVQSAPADSWELAEESLVSVSPGRSPDGLALLAVLVKVGHHRPRAVLTNAVSALDLVAAMGLKLSVSDVVKPSPDAQLSTGMRVKVIRVRRTVETVNESLPYATLIQYSKDLAVGETKLVTQGVTGEVARTYRITYRNGREVSRLVLDEQVLTAPVDEVYLTGNQNTEHG